VTVRPDDPDHLKGELKRIGGSQSDRWNNILVNQTIQTLWLKHSDNDARDRQYSATVWTLAFGHHEDRKPAHGYAATREAAMAAFAKSWRRG
jgi:hypothetical protein